MEDEEGFETNEQFYVVELVGQSHETRPELTNEDVITVPVVDGPFEYGEVDGMDLDAGYAVVGVVEDE